MHYDVAIIGAGMSGLAAGIRLAYFGKRVCIFERHYAYGGLNSYYTLDGREFDVGLHAVTNYTAPGARPGPLVRLLRQLRIDREEFDLRPQSHSEVRFPGCRLQFSNDPDRLLHDVADKFPAQTDGFQRLVRDLPDFHDVGPALAEQSAHEVLACYVSDPLLTDMLLCPVMYYGCAREHDMDFASFVIMFRSIYLEGFARPLDGVRKIIKTLVRRYRSLGGQIRMRCGIDAIRVQDRRVRELRLESGDAVTADVVLSSAGLHETLALCDRDAPPPRQPRGQVSFVETIGVMDTLPQSLGHEAVIVFFNDADRFTYAVPVEPIDPRSGVICCPSNYEGHEAMPAGLFRVTWLANYRRWADMPQADYTAAKNAYLETFLDRAEEYIPDFRKHLVATDMFTPRTIKHYTGHLNGAVYGAPQRCWDGRTPVENLFICGTDQGNIGIIGTMMSGVMMANQHVLAER